MAGTRSTRKRPQRPAKTKRGPGEVSLSVTISAELYDALKAEAGRQQRTLAGQVRYALTDHLERVLTEEA